MDKKSKIQIIVIIMAFSAAGLILYNKFFKNSVPNQTQAPAADSQPQVVILPHGNSLDFSKAINTVRFKYNLIDYPKLDKSEVGKDVDSLINLLE